MEVKALLVKIGADLSEFQRGLEVAGKKLSSFGDKLEGIGKKLSTRVTLPLVAIGAAATKMAVDAVESENLFEVSMGKMAKAAKAWSEELSRSLGLNQYEVRKTVATFNVMLNSMGLSTQQAFSMSKGLTKLAYDMASFYNLKPEEAFLKLQAAISGEIEPLRRLGINVDEATVKAFAYKHGIAAVGTELTQQQKILARYGVIMEATKQAQGDLARTINSPANQLRILKARLEETAITFGQILLPVLQATVKFLNNVVNAIKNMPTPLRTVTVAIAGMAAAAGPLSMTFGSLLKTIPVLVGALKSMSLAFAGVAGAAVAVAVGLNFLINKWKEHTSAQIAAIAGSERANTTWRLLRAEAKKQGVSLSKLSGIWTKYQGNVAAALDAIAHGKEGEDLKQLLEGIKQKTKETATPLPDIENAFKTTFSNITQTVEQFDEEYTNAIQRGQELRKQYTQQYYNELIAMAEEYRGQQLEELSEEEAEWGAFFANLQTLFLGFQMFEGAVLTNIAGLWQTTDLAIVMDVQNTLAKISQAQKQAKEEAKKRLQELQAIQQNFSNSMMHNFGQLAYDIIGAFSKIAEGGKKFTEALKEAFKSFVKSAIEALKELAVNIALNAMKTVLAKKIEAIASVIASVMSSVPFPFNLAVVGGAIAAVTALFSALHLAEGGLVTQPTFALVGEAGPELVIPLDKIGDVLSNPGGGGVQVYQTVNFYGDFKTEMDIDEIAEQLAERTKAALQRRGL